MRAREARLIHAYFGPVAWQMLELKRRVDAPLVVTFLGDDIAPTVNEWWSWWIRSGEEEPDWPTRMREVFAGADLFLAEAPSCAGGSSSWVPAEKRPHPAHRDPGRRDALPRPAPAARRAGDRRSAGRSASRRASSSPWTRCAGCATRGATTSAAADRRRHHDDGSYAARVNAFIREHRLGDRVRLLGFLNHDAYLEALGEADLVPASSVVDDAGRSEEALPTTILEAQALGMPVVSTLHCDIPNVTVPGERLLVPERDGEALPPRWRACSTIRLLPAAHGRAGRRLMEEKSRHRARGGPAGGHHPRAAAPGMRRPRPGRPRSAAGRTVGP